MIHSLTINIDNEKITTTSADGSVLNDMPNIVALYEKNKIISIGTTLEMIQEQTPKQWDNVKDKTHFCNLFSLADFRPELAASAIDFIVYSATHPSLESQKKWTKDTIILQVNILDYEKLDIFSQELFEYCVQELRLVNVKSLIVNNQEKPFSKIHLAKKMARLGLPAFIIFVFLLASILSLALLGERYSVIPEEEKWSFLLVFMTVVFFLTYFASFIFVILWKYATRNLISDSVSIKIMESNKVGLPKSLMNLIWKKLPSKIGGG